MGQSLPSGGEASNPVIYVDGKPQPGPGQEKKIVNIVYQHSKEGEVKRRIFVIRIYFGTHELHPEEQYLMEAIDLDKNEIKTYAMMNVTGWQREPDEKGWKSPSGAPPNFIK